MGDNDKDTSRQPDAGKPGEPLPLDAKLLSEAIIEFNISRRNVGIYPSGHGIIAASIERARELFLKLFEMRSEISLGIAHDALVVDRRMLDRTHPVFRECALSFHEHGIASITFFKGMSRDELTGFHELLTCADSPAGRELAAAASERGITHIRIEPINYAHFAFVEGRYSTDGKTSEAIWQDYLHGLLTGSLSTDDASDAILGAPPEEVADAINAAAFGAGAGDAASPAGSAEAAESAESDESNRSAAYDKVIASYLTKKGETKLSPEAMGKLMTLVDRLNPKLKGEFLSRTFNHLTVDMAETEKTLAELTPEAFKKLVETFGEQTSVLPESLKNIFSKFTEAGNTRPFEFDTLLKGSAVVHDIEMEDEVAGMFTEDYFRAYVGSEYAGMLKGAASRRPGVTESAELSAMAARMRPSSVDSIFTDIMLELASGETMSKSNYLTFAEKLTAMAEDFVGTGRFDEAYRIIEAFWAQAAESAFMDEAAALLELFFHSEEFLEQTVGSIRLWGRLRREESARLSLSLGTPMIHPLMDALLDEQDPSRRKFLISTISEFREAAVPAALKKLKDDRWFVLRNMLVILTECDSGSSVEHVRRFAKHPDHRVAEEAVKYMLKLSPKEGPLYLKLCLDSPDSETRLHAMRQAGAFKVRVVVPLLMGVVASNSAAEEKRAAVRALAEIGEPSVLEGMLEICRRQPMLFKAAHEELRLEIFKTLQHYPPPSIARFVEYGLGVRDENIRKISAALMASVHVAPKREAPKGERP